MRLFIAITFPKEVKNHIQKLMAVLEQYADRGRFVQADNLHLTLEFLGEIETDRVDAIKRALDEVDHPAFTMELGDLGYFEKKPGRIYWIGVGKNEDLTTLQNMIHRLLVEEGFDLDPRPYTPHITIGRKIVFDRHFKKETIQHLLEPIQMNVEKVDLIHSHNVDGKLTYTPIYTKALK